MDECKRDPHTTETVPNTVTSETSSETTLEPQRGGEEGLSAFPFLT